MWILLLLSLGIAKELDLISQEILKTYELIEGLQKKSESLKALREEILQHTEIPVLFN